jgi:hypothetical protein
MMLNKQDWETLNNLLQKIGFGSYHDCIQVLKDTIYNLKPELQCKLEKETNLHHIVILLYKLSNKIKKR